MKCGGLIWSCCPATITVKQAIKKEEEDTVAQKRLNVEYSNLATTWVQIKAYSARSLGEPSRVTTILEKKNLAEFETTYVV